MANATNIGQYAMNVNRSRNLQLPKAKKQGMFEDEDIDSNFFAMFSRPDKELRDSPTTQLSSFGNSVYGQTTVNLGLQQRAFSNFSFPMSVAPAASGVGGAGVPSSLGSVGVGPVFPLSMQQQSQQMRPQPVSPNRSMFGMSQPHSLLSQLSSQQSLGQMKRQNLLTPSLSSTSGGATLMNLSRPLGDGVQPSFDWTNDFPLISGRAVPPSQLLPTRNYVGMVSKPPQESTPEFQIQQEDFPALPGVQNPATTTVSSGVSDSNVSKLTTSNVGGYDQALKETSSKTFTDKALGQQRRGIQTHPDGTVSNIPAGMVADQFGMVGLLTFIRAAENDPNLVALAPGIDLTTLGLNLNSPDNLYSTFQSPWADAPCRPQDIDYHVPSEYLTNMFIREKLAPIKLNRYQEDLLFYLFYVNGGDVLQLAAAAELYNRDWRYHKEDRVWITRAPGMEPITKTNSYERGTYFFFDVHNWRKVAKEFHLEYSKLEDRPLLPDIMMKAT
jgi:CCR4-NOT transcription complex subunit 2